MSTNKDREEMCTWLSWYCGLCAIGAGFTIAELMHQRWMLAVGMALCTAIAVLRTWSYYDKLNSHD